MVRGDNEVVTEPEFPEQFRSYSENEKHWQARRAFILRNAPLEGGEAPTPLRLEQLLSLSMVWANHLFLGCRYPPPCLFSRKASRCFGPQSPAVSRPAGKDGSCRPMHQGNAKLGEGGGRGYNKDLLEKVMEMANGIEVEDVPHFTTRDELLKRINTSA